MAEATPELTVLRVDGESPYDVVVGHDVVDEVAAMLGDGPAQVALCYPESLPEPAGRVVGALGGRKVLHLPLPDGEAAKTAAVAQDCWERLGRAGFTRSDAVVTVGGGATTDLGGFVAATWLRGVPVVHVPTSLLGMVDAAVGGKTGIDTAAGKNLVGSFHEPAGVVCDLDLLGTLPEAELVSGLGEVVKCGFIADPAILDLLEHGPRPDPSGLRQVIERSIKVKISIVTDDLRETGGRDGHPGREALNYGHTMGHAIEKLLGYGIRHGEAVALGMVYVAELARLTGRLEDPVAQRHARVLSAVGLPTSIGGLDFEELLGIMRVDKKARGASLRFVVLDALARPGILPDPPVDALRAAWEVVAR